MKDRTRSFSLILLTAVVLLLASCRDSRTAVSLSQGDTLQLKYAKNITIVRHDGYTTVSMANPWKPGKTLHRYVLVPREGEMPEQMPEGSVLRVPLQRSAVFTTVHCALIEMLGCEESVGGVADLKYIKLPWVHERVKSGVIADFGDGMSPVIEKIIDAKPDAIFLSPFENSGGYGKVEEINVPIVECAEYMEDSPLARAEWVKFYGMLFGNEHRADSLFNEVDSCYHALKQLAEKAKESPSVLMDKQTGSVWYVPGGRSTIGQMITDANARYPWANDNHSGSLSLPFETVLEKAGHCPLWLLRYSSDHNLSLRELQAEHHGYPQLTAFAHGSVYGCNVELSRFYEETPFRPDWLLNDFIVMLHPEIQGLHALRYYHKVEN